MNAKDSQKSNEGEKVGLEFILSQMDNESIDMKKSSEPRKTNIPKLRKELALHEASHLVFDCLGLRFVNGFVPINYIISCPEKVDEEGYNVVNGFAPDVPEHKTYVRSHNDEAKGYLDFYNADRKRLVAKLLTLIAGYSSYKAFINPDEEYYIGGNLRITKGVKRRKYEFDYFNLENALTSNTSDFNKVSKKLRIYYSLNQNERKDAVSILTKAVIELMNKPAINSAIRYVKNKLIKNRCEKIEGDNLSEMIKEVNRLTNKIKFEETLEYFKDEIK